MHLLPPACLVAPALPAARATPTLPALRATPALPALPRLPAGAPFANTRRRRRWREIWTLPRRVRHRPTLVRLVVRPGRRGERLRPRPLGRTSGRPCERACRRWPGHSPGTLLGNSPAHLRRHFVRHWHRQGWGLLAPWRNPSGDQARPMHVRHGSRRETSAQDDDDKIAHANCNT